MGRMKAYQPNGNQFDFSKPYSIPEFTRIQVEERTCPCCHKAIRFAVSPTHIDWEKVANDYKAYANRMWMECNLLLSEAGVDTLLERRLKDILERCKEELCR